MNIKFDEAELNKAAQWVLDNNPYSKNWTKENIIRNIKHNALSSFRLGSYVCCSMGVLTWVWELDEDSKEFICDVYVTSRFLKPDVSLLDSEGEPKYSLIADEM